MIETVCMVTVIDFFLPSSNVKHQQKYCPINYNLYGHAITMNDIFLFFLSG